MIKIFLSLVLFFSGCSIKKTNKLKELTVNDINCGTNLIEASGLVYLNDENKLYIVGDKGILFTCNTKLNKDKTILTLEFDKKIEIKHNFNYIDIEGIDVDYKKELIVSLEGENAGIYKLSKIGILDKDYKLPIDFKDKKNIYRSFESITYHREYGILFSMEFPLNKNNILEQTIYSLDGKYKWFFDMENYNKNGITGLEVDLDGNLLVLERSQINNFILKTNIVKVDIKNCKTKRKCDIKTIYDEETIALNFEGITNINGNSFLIINDNQNIKGIKTIFKYFKIN